VHRTLRLAIGFAPLFLLVACSRPTPDTNTVADAATSATNAAEPELHTLSIDEVSAKIAANDGKTFIYDNNSKDHYVQGHLPTARWVAFNKVTAADLPADKTATLIFYCAGRS
jgi:hypothetical protein